MSKLDKIGYYNKETGEELELEIIEAITEEERRIEIRNLFYLLKTNPDKLTIEQIDLLKKLCKLKGGKIKLDFTSEGYFMVKNSFEFIKGLSIHTRGVIYTIGHMITHDGRLKYGNNHLVSGFEDLREYLDVSKKVWNTYIKKDMDDFNIIVKEKIKDKWCLLINPIFAMKDRAVTETMFIAFHESLEKYLHPLDFLYLKKLHGIEMSSKSIPQE